jgi:hypothetical protein
MLTITSPTFEGAICKIESTVLIYWTTAKDQYANDRDPEVQMTRITPLTLGDIGSHKLSLENFKNKNKNKNRDKDIPLPTNEKWTIAGFGWKNRQSGAKIITKGEKPITRENKKWSGQFPLLNFPLQSIMQQIFDSPLPRYPVVKESLFGAELK